MFVACHHRRHLGRLWVAPLCPSFTHNVRRFAHAFSHKLIYHGLLVCVSILGDGISSVGCPGCPPPPPPPHPQCSRLQIQHGNPLQRIIPILFSMFFFLFGGKSYVPRLSSTLNSSPSVFFVRQTVLLVLKSKWPRKGSPLSLSLFGKTTFSFVRRKKRGKLKITQKIHCGSSPDK